MKKIFILSVLFLMFGLLVGCASKPKTVFPVDNKINNNREAFIQDKQNKAKQKIIDYVHQKSFSFSQDEAITLQRITMEYGQYEGDTWFSVENSENDFVVKISNTTNKNIKLRLISKFFPEYVEEAKRETEKYIEKITENHTRKYNTRCFDVEVPANQTKNIRLPDAMLLNENLFNIYDINKKETLCSFQEYWPSDYKGIKISQMALNEIYRTHSLEIIYSDNNITYHFLPKVSYTNNEAEFETAKRKWFD